MAWRYPRLKDSVVPMWLHVIVVLLILFAVALKHVPALRQSLFVWSTYITLNLWYQYRKLTKKTQEKQAVSNRAPASNRPTSVSTNVERTKLNFSVKQAGSSSPPASNQPISSSTDIQRGNLNLSVSVGKPSSSQEQGPLSTGKRKPKTWLE